MEKIKLTENIKPQTTAFGVKIESCCTVYSQIKNQILCWESGKTSYCLWGDNMTISGKADAEFVKFISPKTVLCSEENAEILKLKKEQNGFIMQKNLKGEIKEIPKIYFENIKEVYNLLQNSGMTLDYEGFVLDTLLKLRSGTGAISCICENSKIIAVAICPYITENFAFISAVAVAKSEQKKGYGKKVLLDLEKKLSGRTVFLLKENEKNDIFYAKLNYSPTGNWVLGGL